MKTARFISILCLLAASFSQCYEEGGSTYKEEEVPFCTINIFPGPGAMILEDSKVTLSWARTEGAASYDIYFATGSDPLLVAARGITASTYTFDVPAGSGVTYKWYVEPKNSQGKSLGCANSSSTFTAQTPPALDVQQKVVNVLVLNYDPEMASNLGPKKLHEFYQWSDPKVLAEGYMQDVLESSGGLIKYNIVEWRDLNEFPVKSDGFVYTSETYMSCHHNKKDCHAADGLDYVRMISDQGVANGINQNEYEEVWLFGAPYFGFWEAAMAGPKSFNINGDIYPTVPTNKAFAIMGFNYERDVAEMMHDLCHRTEGTMSKVYGGWNVAQLSTSWAKFAANAKQSNGQAAVGSCHYPPNAVQDYDYANPREVQSSADDWYTYPLLNGNKLPLTAETWGGPNYERNYLNWWFRHLPHREGTAPDGKLNSWWRYVFDFNETILK